MSSPTLRERRLPGLHFEVAPRVGPTVLPRMDVAGFAGFAEAGPFDTPVLVDDVLRFREIFGADVPLTVEQNDAPATASLLGSTVEGFFANGGRSCWVVRVGDVAGASTTRFRVPGLVTSPVHGATPLAVELAARSPGTRFDLHRAIGWIERRRLPQPLDHSLTAAEGAVVLSPGTQVVAGELLEIEFDEAPTLWVSASGVSDDEFGRRHIHWNAVDVLWFSKPATTDRPTVVATLDGSALTAASVVIDDDGSVELSCADLLEDVDLGAVVVIEPDAAVRRQQVFVVDQPVERTPTGGSLLRGRVGRELWEAPDAIVEVSAPTRVAVIKMSLGALEAERLSGQVRSLDVAATSAATWSHLYDDSRLFGASYRRAATAGEHPEAGPLDEAISTPRFAFACDSSAAIVPLFLGDDPLTATAGRARVPAGSTYERNGLAAFSSDLFIDPAFDSSTVSGIRLDAPRTFFVDELPLRGALALYPLGDVCVMSAPDSVHLGWKDITKETQSPLSAPILRTEDAQDLLLWDPYLVTVDQFEVACSATPDFAEALALNRTDQREFVVERTGCELVWCRVRALLGDATSPWSNSVVMQLGQQPFVACDVAASAIPVLEIDGDHLRWSLQPTPAATPTYYDIERSSDPLFLSADRQRSPLTQTNVVQELPMVMPTEGVRYWRVRERSSERGAGPWSNTVFVEANPVLVRVAEPDDGQVANETVLVHRHLAAITAARQDLTALVSFPMSYDVDLVEDHVAELHRDSSIPAGGDRTWAEFLHSHHPWLGVAAADGRRWVPPDGAIAGAMARVALRRGPWIAAIIDPLRDVTAISEPTIDVLRLRQLQVNGFVARKQRFYAAGVDTLSVDPASIPVTIRRLMILLRRLARRQGQSMLFENNGPVLWRIVTRRFEAILGDLLRRGALAGRSPEEAYRVICDGSVNTTPSIDNGRLIVELQVAPAHPLEFLTVRFTQTDAGGFEFEGAAT